jgi:hypothetical protein
VAYFFLVTCFLTAHYPYFSLSDISLIISILPAIFFTTLHISLVLHPFESFYLSFHPPVLSSTLPSIIPPFNHSDLIFFFCVSMLSFSFLFFQIPFPFTPLSPRCSYFICLFGGIISQRPAALAHCSTVNAGLHHAVADEMYLTIFCFPRLQ